MTTKAAQKISLWEFFQQLGKTFMLPVALLSFCGIMLGIGSSLSSHDVITLIPFLGNPVLQAIFIWRLLSLLTKWLDVGLMCGNFCYVAAIRFVMCNELTSFRGNFMPHPCPITSPGSVVIACTIDEERHSAQHFHLFQSGSLYCLAIIRDK
ncbi:PTS system, maltose and glucose-specific IIC component / PTS system, maltose and glucose-specific IIB component [Enterobacter hormaechei]|nr:PTS system, maltose and glucose-specific IIC component / PTS system, maltose and glucose-specific IIB component [Enterobacter hormaechei]